MTMIATEPVGGSAAPVSPALDPLGREPQSPRERAEHFNLDYVDLRERRIDDHAADSIPLHILTRTRAVPIAFVDGRLQVAVVDPGDLALIDELRLVSRVPLDLCVAAPADIELELKRLARGQELAERAALIANDPPFAVDEDEADLEADDGISDAPPIQLVNSIVVQAAEEGASDVHFLPQGDYLIARMRVDGILHEVERIPKRHATGVITRVKVLAKLDIAEHRLPQDGRLTLRPKSTGRLMDIRVAVLPTVEGEGVIMRL